MGNRPNHTVGAKALQELEDRLDVDLGRLQQKLADRLSSKLGDDIVDPEGGHLEYRLADQAVTVGVETAGGNTDQPVAGPHGLAVDDVFAFHRADTKTGQVVLPGRVEIGQDRRLSADQSAAGLGTAVGDSGNNLL